MAKLSKPSVNYRKARKAPNVGLVKRCGNCDHFSNGTCAIVAGAIQPSDVCDKWKARQTT